MSITQTPLSALSPEILTYISTHSGSSLVFMEVPVGLINGTNQTFTTAGGRKYLPGKLAVVYNTALLLPTDFTEDADHTTIRLTFLPSTGDTLHLIYAEEPST